MASSRAQQYHDSSPPPVSDSENYDGNNELSSSHTSSSRSALILYKPPTVWSLLRGAAINLLLPFVNGMMLGLGELLAHEFAFRLGWSQTKVFPSRRLHTVGPGVELQHDPVEARRRNGKELDILTSLE